METTDQVTASYGKLLSALTSPSEATKIALLSVIGVCDLRESVEEVRSMLGNLEDLKVNLGDNEKQRFLL